jgi:polyisoprenoid-binding protein YceI
MTTITRFRVTLLLPNVCKLRVMVFRIPILLLLILFLCSPLHSMAQSVFRISPADNLVLIRGTSSLHDWQCRVEQITGQLETDLTEGKLAAVKTLLVSFVVSSIRSIRENGAYYEAGMDKNVYKALNSEKHPAIVFNLVRVNSIKPSGNESTVDAVGTLRIAGTSREVPVVAKATLIGGGITFEGKVPLKMTDFKVDPPTALFGTIKTGNEVVIEFKVAFQPVR